MTLRVTVPPVAGAADGGMLPGGGLSGGGVACAAAVDSVKGSGPDAATGCRNTSPPAEVPVPPPVGLVSTTARVTAAARATTAVASRGTDRHQGFGGGPDAPRSDHRSDRPHRPIPQEGRAAWTEGLPVRRTAARKADPWAARSRTEKHVTGAAAAAHRRVVWSRALLPRRRSPVHMDVPQGIRGHLRISDAPVDHCVRRPGGGRKPGMPTVAE